MQKKKRGKETFSTNQKIVFATIVRIIDKYAPVSPYISLIKGKQRNLQPYGFLLFLIHRDAPSDQHLKRWRGTEKNSTDPDDTFYVPDPSVKFDIDLISKLIDLKIDPIEDRKKLLRELFQLISKDIPEKANNTDSEELKTPYKIDVTPDQLANILDEVIKQSQERDNDYSFLTALYDKGNAYYQPTEKPWENYYLDLFKSTLSHEQNKKIDQLFLCYNNSKGKFCFPSINLLPTIDLTKQSKLDTHHDVGKEYEQYLDESFLQSLQNDIQVSRPIKDDPNFRLEHIEIDKKNEKAILKCARGSYQNTIKSCDLHHYYMVCRYPGQDPVAQDNHSNSPIIQNWLSSLKTIVFENNFEHLCATIGISTFLVYKTDDERYEYPIINKSREGNGLNDRHVIPSFIYQPMSSEELKQKNDWKIKGQVYRELAEEFFKHEEFQPNKHPENDTRQVDQVDYINFLFYLEKQGKVHYKEVGLYLDAQKLRPEIITVLLVDDISWYKIFILGDEEETLRFFELLDQGIIKNYNYSEDIVLRELCNYEVEEGGLITRDLSNQEEFEQVLLDTKRPMCSPGAAALIKGREYILDYLSGKRDLKFKGTYFA